MKGFFDAIARPFAQPIAAGLNLFFSSTHSYIAAIAIVTLIVMILVLPLNIKATKSQLELQKHQPEIKRIQAEMKNDRPAQQEAMMALYKEHKINPAGGCLPILLQAPILMGMWRAISGLTQPCSKVAGCVVKGLTDPIPKDTFDPGFLSPSTELFRSLAGKKEMLSFGLDLSRPAIKVIGNNVAKGLPYLALVLVVGVLSYIQQRQLSSRNTAAVNPQQQMIMNLMPIMFGFFSLTFASALIVYFLVQNVFRIGQNAYITRKFYAGNADGEAGPVDKSSAKGGSKKPDATKSNPKPLPKGVSGAADRPAPKMNRFTPKTSGETDAVAKTDVDKKSVDKKSVDKPAPQAGSKKGQTDPKSSSGQRPRPTPPSRPSSSGKSRPTPPKKK
jgi:YidC/Oxa1 family membrane protein insertase